MPQERVMGREQAVRERATKKGSLAQYIDEDVLGMGYDKTDEGSAWESTTTAQPDKVETDHYKRRGGNTY